jgi:hypothetical protein
LCSNLKNDRFTYIQWKKHKKIVVVTGKVEEWWVVLKRGWCGGGRGLLVVDLGGGMFSCRGEEGEIREERIDQVIF